LTDCIMNTSSDKCRLCFELNCNAHLIACTGVASATDLPRPHIEATSAPAPSAKIRTRASPTITAAAS
jgi:hypothetical protein